MFRRLRFVGFSIVQTVIAIVGTAIVEHAIWRLIPAHSIVGILWKECILSTICATSIGFGMRRIWRASAAKWAWILPALWFAFGFLARGGDVWGGLFGLNSGTAVVVPDTKTFFAFTIPLLRAASYSVGAYISSFLDSAPVISPQ
jgi:hypothetical protein